MCCIRGYVPGYSSNLLAAPRHGLWFRHHVPFNLACYVDRYKLFLTYILQKVSNFASAVAVGWLQAKQSIHDVLCFEADEAGNMAMFGTDELYAEYMNCRQFRECESARNNIERVQTNFSSGSVHVRQSFEASRAPILIETSHAHASS